MKKILSISIAAYNVEKYIGETLESLIGDFMDKIEVIIVNDGSKDNTVKVAEEYVEKYPSIFRLIDKENGGYGSTINSALSVAKGKYFKLLDGDDWFDTPNIKKYIEYLEECPEDIVFTQYTEVFEETKTENVVEQIYEYNKPFMVKDINKFCMPSMAIRTEIIKNKFLITEHCFYTDAEYVIKAVSACETCISIPLNIYRYRLGRPDQSVGIKGYTRNIKDHEKVTRVVLPIVANNVKLCGLKQHIYEMAYRHIGYMLYLQPTSENLKSFKEFCSFIKSDYSEIYQSLSGYMKMCVMFPDVFYYPVCKAKRRRNHLE